MARQPQHLKDFCAEELIDQLLYTHAVLKNESDLSPHNPLITETLTALVGNIVTAEECFSEAEKQQVLQNPAVRTIRKELLAELSEAEYEMELYFSNRFLDNPNFTAKNLNEFWYLQNYLDLVDLELEKLPSLDPGQEVVFIGSGPLPLTAIIMAQKTGLHITCLDMDEAAVKRGEALAEKLDMSQQLHFTQAAGSKYDYGNAALVMVASLVADKKDVLAQIEKTSEKLPQVALRSAEGLHALLYDPVTSSILDEFNMQVEKTTTPTPRVINSTLVCRYKFRG
ncbi:MAG: hypothetical protein EA357_09695 [Micavibrio sp.]|nr:MAG: hypothetical protein EA357_09695 [Micavibrio sp.]